MSTLGASRVLSCDLAIGEGGSWRADVILEGGDLPAVGSTQTLTLGDLSMTGVILRAADDAPDRPHVVIEGASGWDKLITMPLAFQSDVGVRVSAVLRALALGAGQTIGPVADIVIGNYYECLASRPGEPVRYRDALNDLMRNGSIPIWRVDADGVTRFGARAGAAPTARATIISRGMGVGRITIGLDSPASFLPGMPFENGTIARIDFRETAHKLEADLWLAEPVGAPSLRQSTQRMLAALFRDFFRTYIVKAVRSDKRLDLRPPPDAPHLPEMAAVDQWTLGGARVTPTVGSEVAVTFLDWNKTRPIVVAFGPGTPPLTELAGGGPGVARVGDTSGRLVFDATALTLYYAPTAIAPYVPVAVNPSSPIPPNPATVGTPIAIATGSDKLQSG